MLRIRIAHHTRHSTTTRTQLHHTPTQEQETMIPTPSKVVFLILLPLILASAFATATAIIDQVQGECTNYETSDGSCEAADAVDTLPAPDGDVMLRTVTPACEDKESECGFWASEGECENNPNYMLREYQLHCLGGPHCLCLILYRTSPTHTSHNI